MGKNYKTGCVAPAVMGVAIAARSASLLAVVQVSPLTESDIDDIRVPALVESTWRQMNTVNATGYGSHCFNYYTPGNSYSSCGATAFAQVMRYHKWPTQTVEKASFSCSYTNVISSYEMIGGVYDWSKMPLVTDAYTTDEECEMIGRLCYDIGVTLHTTYSTSGSGSNPAIAIHSLPDNFHYANCSTISFASDTDSNYTAYDEEVFKSAVIPSLDAGLPAVLSVSGSMGHIIVCDGYGYRNGQFYIHVNLGLTPEAPYDGWYRPTEICPNQYSYYWNSMNGVTYNISPYYKGSIASGRVLDSSGNPVEGAEIKVKFGDWPVTNLVSNAKGIYAFFAPAGTYTVTASKDGLAGRIFPILEPAVSQAIDDGGYDTPNSPNYQRVGNSYGNDVVLAAKALPTAPHATDELVWYTSEERPWTGMTSANFGSYAAIGLESWRETSIAGPADVSFDWSSIGYSGMNLIVTVDGVSALTATTVYSGKWGADTAEKITLSEGVHAVRWTYVNATYSSMSSNAVSLANLKVSYHSNPPEDSDPEIVERDFRSLKLMLR